MRYKWRVSKGQAARPPGRVDPTDVDAVTDAVLAASRLLVAVSARSVAAVDETITLPQFRALVALQTNGPLKLTTLAAHLDVSPSTATRTVDRLVAGGLVDRAANPESRREIVLDLTSEGSRIVNEVTRRRRLDLSRIVARVPPEQRRGLIEALTAFTTAGNVVTGEVPHDNIWA